MYKDWEAVLQEFDDATFRELITAIFRYGFDREEHELSPMARIAMKLIKPVMERDWQKLNLAIYNIPFVGISTIKNYSEEDFDDMDDRSSEILRLAQKIAMKVSGLNEVLALLQLTGTGSTFNSRYL